MAVPDDLIGHVVALSSEDALLDAVLVDDGEMPGIDALAELDYEVEGLRVLDAVAVGRYAQVGGGDEDLHRALVDDDRGNGARALVARGVDGDDVVPIGAVGNGVARLVGAVPDEVGSLALPAPGPRPACRPAR